jgi:hypothetical protein
MNFSCRASFAHLVNLRLKLSIILADILSRRTLRVTLHDSHHHPSAKPKSIPTLCALCVSVVNPRRVYRAKFFKVEFGKISSFLLQAKLQ